MIFCVLGTVLAQRTITGTITDESGEPLIGASLIVKGTSTGTITDIDGTYSLKVPDGSSDILIISYTGYGTKEVVLGASNVLDTQLVEGLELAEVVVTGLGIRREKKALGYAVTTLGSRDIQLKPEADVARVLRGKVPGVDITSTSGLAGSGTNVIIRGYSSITGDNQPLFVVDGVPLNSGTSTDRDFITGSATASSRFLDLDPNSIAEISVLKGLSATVLYGEAGRNGVVLVTTKHGNSQANEDNDFQVNVTQSLFSTTAASVPSDQDKYGNGWQNFAAGAFSNWGAPFDQPGKNGVDENGQVAHPYSREALNEVLPQYVGERYDYKAYDNLEDFFETGLSSQTSLAISKNLAAGTSLNFSYGYLSDDGFVPNSDLKKHNFGLGIHSKLGEKLHLMSTFNFVTSNRNAPPAAIIASSNPLASDDYGPGASLFSNVLYTPRSIDLHGLEYENPATNESIYYRPDNIIQHPLWTSANTNNNEKIRRFFSTIQMNYDLTDWLSVGYRLGLDNFTQQKRYSINKGGVQVPDGVLITSERLNTLLDHTFTATYDTRFTEDLSFDGVVGVNYRTEDSDETTATSTQQFVYGLQTHENYITHANGSRIQQEATLGAFATATLGFKNFVYLSLQGRNDWTSTLEKDNRSFFYPSASVSFIPTEAFEGFQNNNVVNYLKIRAGIGSSAGYPNPYQTRNILGTEANYFQSNDGTTINTNTIDDQFGNPDLTPERHTEFEVGIESKFMKNRIGLDLSLYNKNSTDLIINREMDPSTGYTNSTINAAEMNNKGIELGINVVPVRTKDFIWDINANFTRNRSEVVQLAEGVEEIAFAGYNNLGNFAIPGQPYGVIQGTMVQRTDAGEPIISAAGVYQQAPEIGIIGDPNADFKLNWATTVGWKGLSARVQFDYTHGGDMWASTPSTLYSRGILEETGEFDRFIPVIVPGVVQNGVDDNGDPVYEPNNIQITSNNHFWRNAGVWIDENRMFDVTTIRIREISLSYGIPASIVEKTPFAGASLTLSGQNIWFKALNVPEGANYDPEVGSLGVGNGQGFDFVTGPTAKRWGASLNLSF